MSRVECPSKAWDRYIEGEEDTAEAAMAIEKEILKEAGYPNVEALEDIWTKDFALDTLEHLISSIVRVAHKKGYTQAIQDRKDGQATYEAEQEIQRTGKKYTVVPYLRIDDCDIESRECMPYEDALKEQEHFELMQPENVYKVEEVEDE